ncbi:hypothetical protein [Enorma massiliensis]|uniref:Phage portal protein n=1 Tax=Enorma massiliensis TaxID=1472761 RepID=A0A1Y3U6I9_9ACTN|nr:hypothetical protein [Enorma massiliensis]OUN43765.1 hypothetical protein B5G21_03505 [Enorma massiliensis]
MARTTSPGWALRALEGEGLEPDTSMDENIEAWWSWYDCSSEYYRPLKRDVGGRTVEIEHMTLRPARMVCDEHAALMASEGSEVSCDDEGMRGWLDATVPGLIAASAPALSRAMAVGTAALFPDFEQAADGSWRARMRWYDALYLLQLEADERESVSCAVASDVYVAGRRLHQLKVCEPNPDTGLYRMRTRLFDPGRSDEEVFPEGIIAELDLGTEACPYGLVTPAIGNTYDDATPLGVSVFDDGVDAVKLLDEAFNQFYWHVKLSTPRVFMDDEMVARDPATGRVDLTTTLDEVLFSRVSGTVGDRVPITVYNPEMRVEESERSIDDALSLMSLKCGLGPNYFSFTRSSGLRTATEVVSDNSVLLRTVRRNENLAGMRISAALRGSYAAWSHLSGRTLKEVPECSVAWDDSVIEDTATARSQMKDDIARGLCPRWAYLQRFYGMTEEDARAFTGEAVGAPSGAALDAQLGLA